MSSRDHINGIPIRCRIVSYGGGGCWGEGSWPQLPPGLHLNGDSGKRRTPSPGAHIFKRPQFVAPSFDPLLPASSPGIVEHAPFPKVEI